MKKENQNLLFDEYLEGQSEEAKKVLLELRGFHPYCRSQCYPANEL